MKREELVALGISDDTVIDKIMEINGNDIEHYKSTAETYKSQLKDARDTLKTFEGVDVNELQGKISKLTADLAAKDSDFQSKIADMEFNALLDGQISAAKAKNVKAVKALLDVDALKNSQNRDADIKSAIESVKTDNGYMFEDGKQPPTVTVPGQPASTPSGDKAYIDAFYKNNPFYQKT